MGDFEGDFIGIYRYFMVIHGDSYGDFIGIYRYFMVIQWATTHIREICQVEIGV